VDKTEWAATGSIAEKSGCSAEALWLRQAERDAGKRPDLAMDERGRLKTLESEDRELTRANETLELPDFRGESTDALTHSLWRRARLWASSYCCGLTPTR
jgi:transposase-like protein